jgi:oligopeptide transport system permease protein
MPASPDVSTSSAAAVAPRRDNPLTRSLAGVLGVAVLAVMLVGCLLSTPYTLASAGVDREGRALGPRYKHGELDAALLPPAWAPHDDQERARLEAVTLRRATDAIYLETRRAAGPEAQIDEKSLRAPTAAELDAARPTYLLGTDKLGRDLLVRVLAGGAISIGIGVAAAAISVVIGTLYGALAGFVGGRLDGLMMRAVDVMFGLPTLLLVVLLAVAGDAVLSEMVARDPSRELSDGARAAYEIGVLLVAIGGLSWLTMSRVIRGQVMSLKAQPFMEAARAIGVPVHTQFLRHLLPNLLGPIIVYATLTVPQAMLQESFLSFLGIGVRPPMPSWGNLASDGLVELNPVRIRWWLIVFPCVLLAATLLSLNFVGEGLREAFDPRRARK